MTMRHDGRDEEAEMRSEKVRRLLGDIPPALICSGHVVLAAVFIVLLTVVWLLHRHGILSLLG